MFSQAVRSLARCSATQLRRLPLQTNSFQPLRCLPYSRSGMTFRRTISTPAPHITESHLTMENYHLKADQTMEDLLETLEEILDNSEPTGYEVDYHSGVLTLKLGSHGTYVINKQPPNKQIWLSSPRSGPKRYDFDDSSGWIYLRDGGSLNDLLSEELSDVFSRPITIRI